MMKVSLRLKILFTGLLPWLCLVAVLGATLRSELRDLSANEFSAYSLLLWKSLAAVVFCSALLAFIIITSKSVSLALKALCRPFVFESKDIFDSAHALITSGTELSNASIQQVSNLQQIVSSAGQISAMVEKNAENAKKSNHVSQASAQAAVNGKATVNRMLGSIDEISQSSDQVMRQMQESNKKIVEIVAVIKNIERKTEVINDIVFQTKLLSFNASVEAVRAGEHGRGFSVVAREVGNLATMSGEAAGEISSMLTESIARVESIMKETGVKVEELTSAATSKVEMGKTTAQECSLSLNEIADNIDIVNKLVKEISEASGEQALGVKEITTAMRELDQVTRQNSSRILTSLETSKSLVNGSESLQALADHFSKIIGVKCVRHSLIR